MKTMFAASALLAALTVAAQAQTPAPSPVLEQASEYRFQLDLAVNQTALNRFLPTGWESAVAAQGPAKDCNLRLIFIDRVNILGADNRVAGKGVDRAVYLEAPLRQSGGTATARAILGGVAENDAAAPGTFGVLAKATLASASRAIATANGATVVTEDWDLTGADGFHARMHVKYTRGPANRGAGETRFVNPANPAEVVVNRTETETDIARNVTTTPPDRVSDFSFQVSGGKLAALFDGTQKALSWDAQPSFRRTIVRP